MRKCKFCGKEFSNELNHHYFAGHVANCKKNPDLEKRFEKQRRASFLQRLPRIKLIQNCPKCGKEFELELLQSIINQGKYQKFCSKSCSSKRIMTLEQKEKIRKKLTGKIYPERQIREEHQCVICHAKFSCVHCHKGITCSNLNCIRMNQSHLAIQRVQSGKVNSHSHRVKFLFQDEEIRCDSLMEYACLDWCFKNFKPQKLSRSVLIIEYSYQNQIHQYIPDFDMISQDEKKYIVECKTLQVGKVLSKKWDNYLQKSPLKEMALRDYCEKNNIEVIWFDANRLHRSFYRKLQQYLKNDSHLPSNIYLSL